MTTKPASPKPSVVEPTTVFIVGAGASKEAELPTGNELTGRIASCLNFYFERGALQSGDELVHEALRVAAESGRPSLHHFPAYVHAARRIAAAMPQAISIDNYLDVHSDDKLLELCGKLAIVRTILQAEAAGTMKLRETRSGPTLSFKDTRATYFSPLFQLLTENCKFSQLPSRLKRVCFVVFNYDRCIEQYLHFAVRNYYAVSDSDASDALAALRIYHPYGSVGQLPLLTGGVGVPLGAELGARALLQAADRIKTFTEGTDPNSSEIAAIQNAVRTSRRIVFLGFAYHKLNLQLIAPDMPARGPRKERVVYGTAFGVSRSDRELISIELAARLGAPSENVALAADKRCAELFSEYWRSLSFT